MTVTKKSPTLFILEFGTRVGPIAFDVENLTLIKDPKLVAARLPACRVATATATATATLISFSV